MLRRSHAVLLGVALLVGLTVSAAATAAAKPTVTIGTKNFTEQYVLGQLYKQALEAKGYRVHFKGSIGSSELIDTALTSGKINFYPEYTGVIVTDLAKQPFPKSAAATDAAAKKRKNIYGLEKVKFVPLARTKHIFGFEKSLARVAEAFLKANHLE